MSSRLITRLLMPLTSTSSSRRPAPCLPKLAVAFTLGLVMSWGGTVAAQTPAAQNLPPASPTQAAAPAELTEALTQLDAAATNGDLSTVMSFYSPAFTSKDGLTYDTLQQTLEELWQRYPDLTYATTLDSWEQQGSGFSTVTTTTITGSYPDERRDLKLSATITSRQRFEGNQIVEQEILDERSELSAGEKPPTITVNLPDQVAPGSQFDFDAVVMEPLGERLLLGAALEESITVENYLNPAPVELDLLSSGGLFKVGKAPTSPGDRWVSAVIVRYDGITAVTQRLRVANPGN